MIQLFGRYFTFIGLTIILSLNAQGESVRGYVNVEPFETRVEAICLPAAFAEAWDLPNQLQGSVKELVLGKVTESLKTKVRVASATQSFDFDTTSTQFVVLDPELGYQPDERDSIPLKDAIVGVWMSSLAKEVNELKITWNWFANGENEVPVQVTAGDDMAARFLSLENPSMIWRRSAESLDDTPTMRNIPPVELVKRGHRPLFLKIGIGIFALTGLIVLIFKTKTPTAVFFLIPLAIVALIGAFRFSNKIPKQPNESEAYELVDGLLRNTYHSFDYRDEEDIYEALRESIDDYLLEDIYLEVRKGLELENKGGPRVRIQGLNLRSCKIEIRNEDSGTFTVQSEWDAVGNVSHWGHAHIRDNRYKAILQINASEDQKWKISKIKIKDEKRNSITQKNKAE